MTWLREAISDEHKQADMAYVAIGGLILALINSVAFLCIMSAVSYTRCTQIVDVGDGVRSAIPCSYDPNPLGIAIAACIAAFGSPIGALAGYMVATRRREVPAKADSAPVASVTATATLGGAEAQAPALPPSKSTKGRKGGR